MGVSNSAISRVTGVDVAYKNFNIGKAAMLPQRVAIIGQGNDDVTYPLDAYECDGTSSSVAERYGYGSPLHLAVMQLFPMTGNAASFPVTIYPVKKKSDATKAAGNILFSGTATAAGRITISIGGNDISFLAAKGDTAAKISAAAIFAINAELSVPVRAGAGASGSVDLAAKWSGEFGNDIRLSCDCEADGITVTVTAMTSGSGVPDISDALSAIGEVWETFVLNTFGYKNAALLDTFQAWGEERWSVTNKKPALVCTGCTDDYSVRTAITDARSADFINFLVVSVGSPELPFVVAAKALVSDIVTTADNNPAQNYKGKLSGLKAGKDAAQESYVVRNNAVGKGSSTNIKTGSVAELNDIVTMYHPSGEGKYPSRRYVVDLVKLMNIVYNVRLIIESDAVKGAPLVTDDTVTSNEAALQPKTFRTWFSNLADSLADVALITEPKFTKKNLSVAISSENPKRIDVVYPVKLSGNVEVASVDLRFGFYLG